MKITDYAVITECNEAELEKSVVLMIKNGFQPFGSLVVNCIDGVRRFHQAMVIYGDLPTE